MRAIACLLLLLAPPGPAAASDAMVCISAPYEAGAPGPRGALATLAQELAAGLAPFPSLLHALREVAPELCLDPGPGDALGYYDVESNRIVLAAHLSEAQRAAILLHELRHVDQVASGICPSDDLAMAEAVRATFAAEADASAIAALVAWALREAGDPRPWAGMTSLDGSADIAARLEAAMRTTGDVSAAVAAAFDQWYARPDRTERYYIASCSDYLDRADRSKRLPGYALLPGDYLGRLCRLPDGRPYLCAAPDAPRP